MSRIIKTIEGIAADYVAEAIAEGVLNGAYFMAFKNTKTEDLGKYHSTIGMHIRNRYDLWMPNHPLTQHWLLNPECRNVVDGVDCSEDHPDAVSMEIIRCIHKMVRTKENYVIN